MTDSLYANGYRDGYDAAMEELRSRLARDEQLIRMALERIERLTPGVDDALITSLRAALSPAPAPDEAATVKE